jgi:hypothetical protein
MSVIEVENFFPQEILDKILSIANNNTFTYDKPFRNTLDLYNFDIFKDIEQFCNPIVKTADNNLRLSGVMLWKDEPGFKLGSHVDNKSIHLSIQIYLNDNDNFGVIFNIDGSEKEIKYGSNRGYILHNYIEPRISHRLIPSCHERLSIYIQYHPYDQDGNLIVLDNEQLSLTWNW